MTRPPVPGRPERFDVSAPGPEGELDLRNLAPEWGGRVAGGGIETAVGQRRR